MPSLSNVRLVGRFDPSTKRMISSFSDAGYLIRRPPHPRSCFFEQPQFEGLLRENLLQIAGLAAQVLDLGRGRRSRRVARQAFLPGLEELLRAAIIQAPGNAVASVQFGNAVLALQTIQHALDLLFRRMLFASGPTDVFHNLVAVALLGSGFLSHLHS